MAEIKASMVAELRANTGLGMMECKKALVESQGDMAKAEEILRIKSGNKASKLASRTAAEGIVVSLIKDNIGSLVEINCETDFVAKDDSFLGFANDVADAIVNNDVSNVEALNSIKLSSGITIEERRKEIIAKLGENINIRRIYRRKTSNKLVHYLHGKKIGVLLEYDGDNEVVARDIAMHIVASKPACVSKDQVSQDLIDKEKHIYEEQSRQTGKPEEIVQKMVIGKLNKLFSEIVLLNQSFVKDPELTIEKLLKKNNMKIISFSMFVVGEGIEKKVVDYVAEVAAAAKL